MEDIELKNLTLEDKSTHKFWKVRISGYEDCIIFFSTATESQYAELGKFENLMKTFCSDSNAVALDKALEAVLTFIRNYHISARTVADITEAIVSKSLPAPKKTTQDKAASVLLMCCQIDKFEPAQEELLKGFFHKNPQVVAGCVRVLTLVIREYAQTCVDIEKIMKSTKSLFEHRDKIVRDEVKNMTIQIYCCIGDDLRSKLTSLKPLILQDLEIQFKKYENTKSTPKQMVKSLSGQEIEKKENVKAVISKVEGDEVTATEIIKPDISTEEVNILKKLPPNFYEKIESKKWQERKESLEELLSLSKNSKLASGDYYDLIMALLQIVGKDTNVMVVTLAGNCLTSIAKGLQKKFSLYTNRCLKTILSKFKEKKLNVLNSLRDAADAVYHSANVDSIRESVLPFLNDKNPNVKQETALFISRCFCYCTPKMLNRKVLKFYVSPLLKILNDSVPSIRESAAEALGTALKVVGEAVMVPLLEGVEVLKFHKIKEYSDKAKIYVNMASLQSKVSKGIEKSNHSAGKVMETAKKIDASGATTDSLSQASGKQQPGSTAGKKKREYSFLQANDMKQVRVRDAHRFRTNIWDLKIPIEELVAQLKCQMRAAAFSEEMTENLFHSNSKLRMKCIDILQKELTSNADAFLENLDLVLQWFTLSFFDMDEFVIKRLMEYLTEVINRLSDMSYTLLDYEAQSLVPFLISLLGNSKYLVKDSILNIILQICNIYPASKMSPFILNGLKEECVQQKAACLNAFSTLVKMIGVVVCQPTIASTLKDIANLIGDEDDCVRTAAENALVQVYIKEQDKLYQHIGTLPEKDKLLLEEGINRWTTSNENKLYSLDDPKRQLPRNVENRKIDKPSNIVANTPIRKKELPPVQDTGINKSKFQANVSFLEKSLCDDQFKETFKSTYNTSEKKPVNVISPACNKIKSPLRKKELPPVQDTEINKSKLQANTSFLEKSLYDDQFKATCNTSGKKPVNVFSPVCNKIKSPLRLNVMPSVEDTVIIKSKLQTNAALDEKLKGDYCQENSKVNSNTVMKGAANMVSTACNKEKSPLRAQVVEDKERVKSEVQTDVSHLDEDLRNESMPYTNSYKRSQEYIVAVISKISHRDYQKVEEALSQLEKCIRLQKTDVILPQVDQLLTVVAGKYKSYLDSHDAENCIRMFRLLTNFLTNIFQEKEIATGVSRDSIYDVSHSILNIIVYSKLCQFDGGIEVARELNALVILIIQNADFTQIFSALLKLLHIGVQHDLNGKFTELAMKCTWKAIRALPSRRAELNVSQILFDLNDFILAFPLHSWSDKPSNKPLRTIKTVLYNLAEVYGNAVLQHLHQIPNYEGSELEKYMMKSIKESSTRNMESNDQKENITPKESNNLVGN